MGETEQQCLIPGLPDEIALDCLVRVPYQSHLTIRSVCRTWRNLVTHPSFYQERQRAQTAEHLISLVQAFAESESAATDKGEEEEEEEKSEPRKKHCPPLYGLSIYNLTKNSWHRTKIRDSENQIPMFCECVALPASRKVILLGGWDPTTLNSVPDVHVCDLARGGVWRRAAPMLVARSFFACAALGPSSVYVAGGHDNQKNALRSAEIYDVERDTWRSLPEMVEERDECHGLSCNGKFWAVSGYGTESQGRFKPDAEWFDTSVGSWAKVHGVWPFPNTNPRATTTTGGGGGGDDFDGLRWWFVRSGGGGGGGGGEASGVMKYNGEDRRWEMLGSIPKGVTKSSSSTCVAALEDHRGRIFVMGSGSGYGHCAYVWEAGSSGCGSDKNWTPIQTPSDFSGFVYSGSSLLF